ncbi:MAG: gamma-glutamylcyclotransferase [Halomonadaceae bacterium]|nr:MAG: gamma-glutamylcyclotransferase [Halomonadaceae bacterium]
MTEKRPLLRLKWLLLGCFASLAGTGLIVWLMLFSALGYEAPPETLALESQQQHHLFVYGTLRNPLVRYLVIGRPVATSPASVSGFRRQGLNLKPAENSQVTGRMFTVYSEELRRLDRYERLGVRYERVRVTLDQDQEAWVYQRLQPPLTSP